MTPSCMSADSRPRSKTVFLLTHCSMIPRSETETGKEGVPTSRHKSWHSLLQLGTATCHHAKILQTLLWHDLPASIALHTQDQLSPLVSMPATWHPHSWRRCCNLIIRLLTIDESEPKCRAATWQTKSSSLAQVQDAGTDGMAMARQK